MCSVVSCYQLMKAEAVRLFKLANKEDREYNELQQQRVSQFYCV
jgi:hypothetical protein